MHHELKIKAEYLKAILEGRKTFEIRNNDRDYQEGDTIWFYSRGRTEPVYAKIGFVTDFEQKKGYVVFSLLDIKDFTE